MNSKDYEKQLAEVKAEIRKIDDWFEYDNLVDDVYFGMLRKKRELLLKRQQLEDRLDPRKQNAYMPDKIEIINP